jgi:phosphoserine phosphatase/dolichol kinase
MVHLVIFDVEGVILPRKRTLLIDIVQQLKERETLKLLIFGFLYQLKIIPFNNFIKKSYKLFKGSPIDIFFDIYYSTPVSKNSEEVIRRLRERDITTALISSGLPQEIVEELKEKLGANLAYGIHVDKDEYGTLSGEISGDVIEYEGKRKILKRIVEEMGIDYDDVAVVADDINNLQMLEDCGLFIGFNPENEVASRTEVTIIGNDLQQVYNVLLGQPHSKNVLIKEMLLRKATHSLGALTLLLMTFFGLFNTQLLIITIMVLFTLSEYLRLRGRSLPVFTWITCSMALGVEKTNIVTTPIWYALGVFTTITFFPFRYALIGVLTLTLGDVAASLVGQSLAQKHSYPFNKSKSIEGTLAGFLVAVLACSIFTDPYISLIGCLVGMIVEVLPLPLNDNITVPFFSSLASLMFGQYWFVT